MTVYLGEQRDNATPQISATHGTVLQLTSKVEGVGHKLFMNNYFSSPDLFNDLHERKINSCGTIRHNRKGMPKEFSPKVLKLKRGDIFSRVKDDLCVVCWKDKREVYLLTNMHNPPASGHFVGDDGFAPKPLVIENYNTHMGYVDKSDRVTNSYGISHLTWNFEFIHNSKIMWGGKLSHKEFRESLIRNLIQTAQDLNPQPSTSHRGRRSTTSTQLSRLDSKFSKHWPVKTSSRRCKVCSDKKKISRSMYSCEFALQYSSRDADEMENWIAEKLQLATEESYKDPANIQSKHQKHQAFEAELAANADRIQSVLAMGQNLIDKHQCAGSEEAVQKQGVCMQHVFHRGGYQITSHFKNLMAVFLKQESLEQPDRMPVDLAVCEQFSLRRLCCNVYGSTMMGPDHTLPFISDNTSTMISSIVGLRWEEDQYSGHHIFPISLKWARLASIADQWEYLTQKTTEKTVKLKEANKQRTYIAAVKDLDFWLGEVESLLTSEDSGKDLASVQNLIKKHQLVEADIQAHDDRIKDMNGQADSLIESGQFDTASIQEKRQSINERYERIKNLAAHRQARLNEANTLHQFFRDIADEESWIKEKKLLVCSEDYGRDLTGVQNLKKKHKRLETELASHEPAIQAVQEAAEKLMDVSNLGVPEIEQRLKFLNQAWAELKQMAATRGQKLEESLTYQQFLAKLIMLLSCGSEKQQLLSVEDYGDTMAAVQGLLKKHDAFETDFAAHRDRCTEICSAGEKLITDGNHHSDSIAQRCQQLQNKLDHLAALAARRKAKLMDNSAYLQFMWKADVVESWIADKETHVRSEEFGRDLSTVQTLLTKQETFDAGLHAFEHEGIQNITLLKDQWQKLLNDSDARKQRLIRMQEQFRQIEELYLTFAKKASAFNSWFENAEEDLTDPVRCNSIEEIRALREAHAQFQASLSSAQADFEALAALDQQIKSFNVGPNPYTWFTMEALEDTWRNLQKIIKKEKLKKFVFHLFEVDSFVTTMPNDHKIKMATLQQHGQTVVWYAETKSVIATQRNYRRVYGRDAPDAKTIKLLFNKLLMTGSVLKQSSEVRRSLTEEKGFQRSPSKSIRHASRQFNVSTTTVHRVLHKRLRLYQYKMQIERDIELAKEAQRQEENDKLRKEFAKHANAFHQWLTETRQKNSEKVEEREDKETVDGSTQTINSQAIERQKLIDEIGNELGKDLSTEELQEIVKINWPKEVFKQCQFIKGEILQREDEDLFIITKGVENKETKIMNKIKYINPQIQKIMDEGKIKTGKMICSITLNETMGEDFEERNNKRFIYVIVTEDGGNTIEDKANLMTNLDKILNIIRKNARINTTCITIKCVEERSMRKVVEYFGRKNDIQISMYNTKEGENVAQENQMEEF
ncbi:hypothetical protein C0J52_21000 [Blattella germanica]|nr:hypothetical protein C0J52_21000 [Blattella germanica]